MINKWFYCMTCDTIADVELDEYNFYICKECKMKVNVIKKDDAEIAKGEK